MASIIKVDRILDSTELGKVDIPGGIETDVLNATELIADTWKNVDGTENYKCRCWVNFDGTTTPPTIRASGNVSSVSRNATGDYTVNFTTAMPDTNYVIIGSVNEDATTNIGTLQTIDSAGYNNTSSIRFETAVANSSANRTNANFKIISLAVFR